MIFRATTDYDDPSSWIKLEGESFEEAAYCAEDRLIQRERLPAGTRFWIAKRDDGDLFIIEMRCYEVVGRTRRIQ